MKVFLKTKFKVNKFGLSAMVVQAKLSSENVELHETQEYSNSVSYKLINVKEY